MSVQVLWFKRIWTYSFSLQKSSAHKIVVFISKWPSLECFLNFPQYTLKHLTVYLQQIYNYLFFTNLPRFFSSLISFIQLLPSGAFIHVAL